MTKDVCFSDWLLSIVNPVDLQVIIRDSSLRLADLYEDKNEQSLQEKLLLIANFIVPNEINTLARLSNFYYSKHEVDKAIKFAENILDLTKNKNVNALLNAGILYADALQTNKAITCFEKCLKIEPNCYKARFGIGVEALKHGNFSKGWKYYYARHKAFDLHDKSDKSILNLPLWDGKSSGDVLFYNEQGYGDFFFSLRFFEKLPKNLKCKLFVDRNLYSLMKNTIYGSKCTTKIGCFDFRCSMLDVPYLFKDSDYHADAYTKIFTQYKKLKNMKPKIGLVFSGNPNYSSDFRRSIKLSAFSDILKKKNIEFYLIQKKLSRKNKFYDCELSIKNLAEKIRTFEDTRTILMGLDGLITVDTGLAHLAGAIGLPTLVLLDYSPDFRWQSSNDTTPWYKSWKIFRQVERGDWKVAIEECGQYLDNFISLRQ